MRANSSKVLVGLLACALLAGSASAQERPCPGRPAVDVPAGYVVIEEDIVVPEDWCRQEGAFTTALWPNGVVPYLFSPNVSPANQQLVLLAMQDWEAVANVDFRVQTSEPDFLFIQASTVNNSHVGVQGGLQVVNIASWASPNAEFIIAHELGHALGYWHEQSRLDQPTYVLVDFDNVCQDCFQCLPPNCCLDSLGNPISCNFNFFINPFAGFYGPYDFDSVMHYGQFAFSKNGQPTIDVLPPNEAWQSKIGQRDHLSVWDGLVMSFLYPEFDWTFVDATASGSLQLGTFQDPLWSFTSATLVTPSGGTIWILDPASYPETGEFTQAVTVLAPQAASIDGPPLGGVVIGS